MQRDVVLAAYIGPAEAPSPPLRPPPPSERYLRRPPFRLLSGDRALTRSAQGTKQITAKDRDLIQVAEDTLRRTYRPGRHTVSAALRTASGRIYTGINIETTHGPCAEPVAIGAALTNDDRAIEAIVAVRKSGNGYEVLPPCGTCRQILID
ncbi:MAG: hypothetical protein AABY08_00515, partial [Candidatus Thermoplasmatota archaeon]